MAFDMHAGEEHDRIEHSEESMLSLAGKTRARYPRLTAIWTRFYDDPCIEVEEAGALVLELQDLLASNGGASNRHLAATVARLSRFFGDAHRDGRRIQCLSD